MVPTTTTTATATAALGQGLVVLVVVVVDVLDVVVVVVVVAGGPEETMSVTGEFGGTWTPGPGLEVMTIPAGYSVEY